MGKADSPLALTRRGMLVGMAALTAASAAPLRRSSHYDVVVIGAGSAGIGASRTLQALGRSCLVIEAANRVGGRAFTDSTTFPMPFDIGCAWIHAGMTNPYYAFALERGYHIKKHDVDTLHELFYSGEWKGEAAVKAVADSEETIIKIAQDDARHGRDVPLASIMPSCEPPMAAAATFMGPMDSAVDFSQESTFDLRDEESADYDPNYLVREGFGALVVDVAKGISVSLSTAATAIRSERSGVAIETNKGTIRAKKVIVTASTGVLQKDAIRFEPRLPVETDEAIHSLPMGLLTKIPLLIPGVSHDSHEINPGENVMNLVPPKPGSPPCQEADGNFYYLAWPWDSDLMVGFVGGSYAWELAGRPDAEVIDVTVANLAQIYGNDIKRKVTKSLVTPWGRNPLTHGAYAAAVPGHSPARDTIRLPVQDRIWFAGEAAAQDGLFATCGGAYLSGTAQARAVHRAIGNADKA
ncbi:MAG: FAD-dependent oxidoreductase [Alphaproteobacteria bacterium]|nr:FAD-dependent oxidoreductase [Alphaproteobacteria bacterium]MBL6939127.1 FAD-dependent oxidoreductase [Alphaproteobacteria bacterium]MBL7096644.1 FAD-dependent oxidoreductase [Alphaproteobacteria bacterium]